MRVLDNEWYRSCNWYHIYPIGLLGVERSNSKAIERVNKLEELGSTQWVSHFKSLNIGGVYIGPVFESTAHGYDTADLFSIDRRLGSNDDFKNLVKKYHSIGIKVIVDAVFNHVGRSFFAFDDIRANGIHSKYCNWFKGLDFSRRSEKGDDFTYTPWEGYYELVTLNHENPQVRKYLYDAVEFWYSEFEIDGLRLDAADCISIDFWRDFRGYCKDKFGESFALLAEIIHGDQRLWVRPNLSYSPTFENTNQPFDGVTNYILWDAIWKSHRFKDLDLLVNIISMQRDLLASGWMYNFVDNHDVTRIASQMEDEDDLLTIFIILFTLSGSPSIYYGSEFKFKGVKGTGRQADLQLRPRLSVKDLEWLSADQSDGFLALVQFISQMRGLPIIGRVLTHGECSIIFSTKTILVFERRIKEEFLLVAINIDTRPVEDVEVSWNGPDGSWRDILSPTDFYQSINGKIKMSISANWAVLLTKFVPSMTFGQYRVKKFKRTLYNIPTLSNSGLIVEDLN
ncbi:alpha amylase [Cryptosporidium canis]|uniref:Alpha amylase n=1 Tax=Cryptosporidium canis TaxID=195482 RepID=A0A9D5DKQ5_9CRYT|nr:alpha amylase [Cryptosporidium canis]